MATIREFDLTTPDGRTVHAYDSGPAAGPAVFWHAGTPNVGVPPEPLQAAADALGVRWLGADRPGYGASTPWPDGHEDPADAADDAVLVADAVGVERFALLSHSGGGPYALATAVRHPRRVSAAAVVSSPAPGDASGFDVYAGMAPGVAAERRAAVAGREALVAALERDEFDETSFIAADYAALSGEWSWFEGVVRAATTNGLSGFVADDLGMVAPWGAGLAGITAPVLLVHGEDDRMVPASHSRWLASRIPDARLRITPGAGHISVLHEGAAILGDLVALAARG